MYRNNFMNFWNSALCPIADILFIT